MVENIIQSAAAVGFFGLLIWSVKRFIDKATTFPKSADVFVSDQKLRDELKSIAKSEERCRNNIKGEFRILEARMEEKEKSLTGYTEAKTKDVEKHTMEALNHTYKLIQKDLEFGAKRFERLEKSVEKICGQLDSLQKSVSDMRRDLPKRSADSGEEGSGK